MEALALEKADKLLQKENQSRRKLRHVQVREQSNEWMERNRKKYLEEKERQIQLITDSLTIEAQNRAVKRIEDMEKMHDLCSAQVGAAHRAAAGLPDFEMLKTQKNYQNVEKAKDRGIQALAHEKLATEAALKTSKQARILRENMRREEDYKLKEFVARSVHATKSQAAVERIVDKLTNKKTEHKRRPEYQPSLAKTLRVPHVSSSDAKLTKTKKPARLSRKTKDVSYYDSAVPQNSLKYPQPPGLVQKHTKAVQPSNAFETAQRIAAQQEHLNSIKKLEDFKKAKEADKRGKSALKVAKLQRQLDQITNEFEADGFVVDPKLNDSFLGLSNSEDEEASYIHDEQKARPKSTPISQARKGPSKLDKQTEYNFISSKKPESGDNDSKRKTKSLPPAKSPILLIAKQKTEITSKTPVSPILKQKVLPRDKLSQPQTKPQSLDKPPATGTTPPKKLEISHLTDRDKSSRSPTTSPAKKPQVTTGSQVASPTSPRKQQLTTGSQVASPTSSRKQQLTTGSQTASPTSSAQAQQTIGSQPVSPTSSTKPQQELEEAPLSPKLEKPKLISTRKSIRQQQQAMNTSGSQADSVPLSDGESDTTSLSKISPLTKGETKESQTTKAKLSTKPKSKLSATDPEKESSSSMHTLSSASPDNVSDQPITDYFSPPDHTKSFPLTSTPAEEGVDGPAKQGQQRPVTQRKSRNSTADSSRNTTTTGTLSPQTVAKRKRALHYYVTKLLQMRPESMCNLHASSSVSVSSYVEIPTSAVSSMVGSEPPSESLISGYSIPNGLLSWRTACPENGTINSQPANNTENTENSSPSYNTATTLSSVTEEDEPDEIEGNSLKPPDDTVDDDSEVLNQVSSSETVAKFTVNLSPRSKK